jgi:hypothetical protein
MTTVQEIERAVDSLPEREYTRFRKWFLKRDWARWDREIGEDSKAGRLDFLKREAANARAEGRLKAL